MVGRRLRCRRGYRYQVATAFEAGLVAAAYPILAEVARGVKARNGRFVWLQTRGPEVVVRVERGYAWDGASGGCPDLRSIMRGALVHDALYQLLREGRVPMEGRSEADRALHECCRADGLARPLAWLVWAAVRVFGFRAASGDRVKDVEVYP